MRWLALALSLAQVVSVPVAGGNVQADAPLAPAVVLLAHLEAGAPLVAALARGGVSVELAAEPLESWADYDADRRAILVHPSLRAADPRTLAALLPREATHAEGELSGTVKADADALGSVAACYGDEERAALTELWVWLTVYGPHGTPTPSHLYEHELNAELAQYLAAPGEYPAHLALLHRGVCEPA